MAQKKKKPEGKTITGVDHYVSCYLSVCFRGSRAGKELRKNILLVAKFTNSVGGNNALISLKARGFPLPGEPVTGQTEHRQMMPNL